MERSTLRRAGPCWQSLESACTSQPLCCGILPKMYVQDPTVTLLPLRSSIRKPSAQAPNQGTATTSPWASRCRLHRRSPEGYSTPTSPNSKTRPMLNVSDLARVLQRTALHRAACCMSSSCSDEFQTPIQVDVRRAMMCEYA